MNLQFGALSPKLSSQLKGRVSAKAGRKIDMLGKALTTLRIHGITPGRDFDRSMMRLVKLIEREMRDHAKQNKVGEE